MNRLPWTPWHQVVELRDDLRSGELSLAMFAADLYDVVMGKARPIYQDPAEFFALTYPTFNLRELAKEVVRRLAGQSDKAIRQLTLTYGGGKTHALITLLHLVSDPGSLPKLSAVSEFLHHIGMTPPRARVAALCFDKLDVEKGMEVRAPNGESRWLKHPWSVLAYQIAGSEGLKQLHADNKEEERESAPAENLLADLLALPGREGLATLVLIDEVLMYAREKVGLDPEWRSRLQNFFQYLTQAATKVNRCAVVASLLATDPAKSDELGRRIINDLSDVFQREQEEPVEPVGKQDVAEVLRRRFFTSASIADQQAFRSHVVAALQGIAALDPEFTKNLTAEEERFRQSYPFHPDLTEVFYSKWTNVHGFQRTRGVLRTFAMALRDAEAWDQSPLVGPNVFLAEEGRSDLAEAALAEAARELAHTAATQDAEGPVYQWTAILQRELGKARTLQRDHPGLGHRELEQVVLATFLHSQPVAQKARAQTRELMALVGATRPDRITLEKALREWAQVSWYLDEEYAGEAMTGDPAAAALPKLWRMGPSPNLRQMHDDACSRVSDEVVESELAEQIGKLRKLTDGAAPSGARTHNLPGKPSDIQDDGEFHYAVLGPKAASESGKPSPEACRFLNETSTPDRPRVYRNAVVLLTPARDGLQAARNRIRDHLGWVEVEAQLKKQGQEVDPIRQHVLARSLEETRKAIPEAIRQAYCIVVTVGRDNQSQAFKITVDDRPAFEIIKGDERSRIQDTPISAEALLPGGPYDLWREEEPARRVKDLVGAFAQFPRLPKMLNRQAIIDTLVDGCAQGLFVLRLERPDHSVRTFWRERPDEVALKDPALEAVLPQEATLSELAPELLTRDTLPGLWTGEAVTVGDLYRYFAGGQVVMVPKEGYEEPLVIPKAEQGVVDAAVKAAVEAGKLWLTAGEASLWGEAIPEGLLNETAVLRSPPPLIPTTEILPDVLPEAWQQEVTTARAIADALSAKSGLPLPWKRVSQAIDGAFTTRRLERTHDSGPWPCGWAGAQDVRLRLCPGPVVGGGGKGGGGLFVAEADLEVAELQDLAERIGEIKQAAVGVELKLHVRVELGDAHASPPQDVVERVGGLLTEVTGKLEWRERGGGLY